MEKVWHRVGTRAEIESRAVKRAKIGAYWVALLVQGGRVYAVEDECPHRGAFLSDGKVTQDGYVVCPLHSWEFALKTGEGRSDCFGCVAWFEVSERDGEVF